MKRHNKWDLGRVVKWIVNDRLDINEIYQICKQKEYFPWTDEIERAFTHDKSLTDMSTSIRYEVINRVWEKGLEWCKWTPFDEMTVYKTIVLIELIK